MDTCHECGGATLQPRVYGDVTVQECDLCGALQGDGAAVQSARDAQQAAAAGVDVALWSLVRQLDELGGLQVYRRRAGSPDAAALPAVPLLVLDGRGLTQLENVARSLQLLAGSLGLPWRLEVECRDLLVVVLRPRPAGAVTAGVRAQARVDAQELARALARDQRLSWWRHPG